MIWHSSETVEVLKQLSVTKENGLANAVALERLETYGKNSTATTNQISLFSRFLSQLKSKVVYFLIAVSIAFFAIDIIAGNGNFYFSLLIIAIVLLNAFISAVHLHKCDEALDEIKEAANPMVTVIRDGNEKQIPSEMLVPGDIIRLSEGDYITADARIIEADGFRCSEAILSGEVVPVEKFANVTVEDITAATARPNMVFAGCSVVHGTALAVVVETGLNTEIGKQADIIRQTNSETLPITTTLEHSGKLINIIVLVLCIVAFFIGIILNFDTNNFALDSVTTLLNAVALGISAMPESLPAISTIVIALGIKRMIDDNIIIKNTKALELLGKTEVICVDKTGILTKNNMELSCIFDGEQLTDLSDNVLSEKTAGVLQLATACSMLENDSTEISIENACIKYLSLSREEVGNLFPRLSAIPFDSVRKTMTSINMISGKPVAIVKGAPENVIPNCNIAEKDKLLELYNSLTEKSYRVICIALKPLDEIPSNPNADEIESNLTFVGLICLNDPPQSDTVEAVNTCNIAGIKTIMITGDNISTAKAIARRIGILTDDNQAISGEQLEKLSDEELTYNIEKYTVYARITPDDKVRIINAWQRSGKIVAVTGNGFEDAEALSAADIGCTVGKYGADVAVGNADVIIKDKKFMSIIRAIRESRALFDNVKKAISYLLACNFGEIATFIFGMIIFGTPPLVAVQLLWINLLTDCTSVISLTIENSEPNVMHKKPLTLTGHLFSRNAILNIVSDSLIIAVLTLIAYAIGGKTAGSTMAFATLVMLQVFHSFNMKTQQSLLKANFKSNKFMNFSSVLVLIISIFLVLTPAGALFELTKLELLQFVFSFILAIVIIPISEIKKIVMRKIVAKQ
ncbi:MAG: cation-transporting P-type ATPase [Clostridia bacterium]|nr:cation-transporting P-type ATPase [Clostridia bacterium]